MCSARAELRSSPARYHAFVAHEPAKSRVRVEGEGLGRGPGSGAMPAELPSAQGTSLQTHVVHEPANIEGLESRVRVRCMGPRVETHGLAPYLPSCKAPERVGLYAHVTHDSHAWHRQHVGRLAAQDGSCAAHLCGEPG